MNQYLKIAIEILLEEKRRITQLRDEYSKELPSLPKGSVQSRTFTTGECYYLACREEVTGNLMYHKIGFDEQTALDVKKQVDRRRNLEKFLRQAKKELYAIEQSLKPLQRLQSSVISQLQNVSQNTLPIQPPAINHEL
jgi:hypothetical protein